MIGDALSEYQYYEFLAIDRPLSAADMRWLRSLSSRAHITATSLTNTYHWGGFKGDPHELMNRCFDAHVYTSNFGIRRLMLKLPADASERCAMKAYRGECGVAVRPYPGGIVLNFALEEEPGEWDDNDDGTGWMASLAALRAELLDGDWRSLYLAWLLNIQFESLDDDEREPPVPAGLGALSAPCDSLVDFLHIDRTLLAVAAEQSPPLAARDTSEGEWRGLVADLSAAEKDDMLLRFIMHDDATTRRSLRKRLCDRRTGAAARIVTGKRRQASGGRAVAELSIEWRRRVAIAQQCADEAAARELARAAEVLARTRREHLAQLAASDSAVWNKVNSLIACRTPKCYDQALALLTDLRDAAALVQRTDAFSARLRDLRQAHASKPSLIKRMDGAELC
ncbi:MAG: hypothetical protein JNG88_05365 [Phycisphaerales bacterium]|nr:hypothetical protein [Phycisphaerales bacterium]